MRFKNLLLVSGAYLVTGCVSPQVGPTPVANSLSSFQGTYRGFSPTDESAVAMGEIEIVVTAKELTARVAMGHHVQMEKLQVSEFAAMTQEELATELVRPSSAIVGFKERNGGSLKLLFATSSIDGFGLIIRNGGGDILGPTILFNPAQVARGDFDKAVASLEAKAGKGALPRLRNNGKAEK